MSTEINIQALKNGDEAVFEELFRSQYPLMCGAAMKYVPDQSQAEEMVQEVFFKLWENRQSLQIESTLTGYLFRSVRNHCLNWIKHNRVVMDYEADRLKAQTEDGSDASALEQAELQGRIQEAIENLPEERRKIFKMSRLEGLKYKEIADKLNISIKTVENQMGKALKSMREELIEFMPILIVTIYWVIEKIWMG